MEDLKKYLNSIGRILTPIDKSIAKAILSKYVEYYKKDVSSLIRDSYKYIIDRVELCNEIEKFEK
ncbi:MAG: hypothetical protein ACRC6T_08280 [Sarcina sp.]